MAWQGIEAPKNIKKKTIEFPAAPSFFSSKKWIKLIPKTIGNRKKRLCVRLRPGDKHHLRKSADRKAQIRKAFVPLTGLICAFRSADFLRWCLSPERNLTHNLFFLFPVVFGISFFWSECERNHNLEHGWLTFPQKLPRLYDIFLFRGKERERPLSYEISQSGAWQKGSLTRSRITMTEWTLRNVSNLLDWNSPPQRQIFLELWFFHKTKWKALRLDLLGVRSAWSLTTEALPLFQ